MLPAKVSHDKRFGCISRWVGVGDGRYGSPRQGSVKKLAEKSAAVLDHDEDCPRRIRGKLR